jgi:SIR2-like domain
METGEQIIKCREDKTLVTLMKIDDVDGDVAFTFAENQTSSAFSGTEQITPKKLRTRIEPWLTALFQTEHFGLLIGSGLTHAVHYMAAEAGLPGMSAGRLQNFGNEVEKCAKKSALGAGRREGNFEDQIRTANELLRGIEILWADVDEKKDDIKKLRDELSGILKSFAGSILVGEKGIVTADEMKRERACSYLVSFLMSFASRTGTRDRLQIFTTNYDRLIEMGAELAGLHLVDRFVGTLAPIFRSSRLDIDMHYNPPGIRGEPRYLEGVARFTKLHGSVDWISADKNIRRIGLPFGCGDISPFLKSQGPKEAEAFQLMVYPNSAKDRETAAYPYVELFRDLAAAVCRPNSTLVCYGYSFGDEHINRVIEDMLTIPSTHLVVISYDDPLGRIQKTYEKLGRRAQLTVLMGNHLGNFQSLVDYYLPKPAIDRTTFKMADLLKARWSSSKTAEDTPPPPEMAPASTADVPPVPAAETVEHGLLGGSEEIDDGEVTL